MNSIFSTIFDKVCKANSIMGLGMGGVFLDLVPALVENQHRHAHIAQYRQLPAFLNEALCPPAFCVGKFLLVKYWPNDEVLRHVNKLIIKNIKLSSGQS